MFKMLFIFAMVLIVYFMYQEIMNIRKRSKANKELEDVQTAEDLFETEKEVFEREEELKKKKEALYSKDEVTEEPNQDA